MIEKINSTIKSLSQTGNDPGLKLSFLDSFMVLLICMVVITTVLITIMGILYLFKFLGSSKKEVQPIKPVVTAVQEDEDEEIVAAIMSAVTVFMEAESDYSPAPFIIKNIKRIK